MTQPSRIKHSKDSLALCLVVSVILCLMIFSVVFRDGKGLLGTKRLFFGAVVGIVCGTYVIYRLKTDPRFQTPMMKLTFYRVVAELGISVRFLMSPYVNHELCDDYTGCTDIKEQKFNADICAPWSAMLQFFLIASELWFMCIAFDFAVTLSNPFSPFKDRLKKYHIFCWGIAFITAVAVGADSDLHGVWYASSDVASETFCWISVESGDITDVNVKLWILFYIPLLVIYIYGIYVTCCAYAMLSHGIQVTFVHRARVLFYSQLLLVIYISYWAFLLVLYLGIFTSKKSSLWHWMLFFIPARGILGIFVLFCTQYTKLFSDDESGKETAANEEYFDLNSALQNEIVAYATVGIKESALLTYKESFLNHEYSDTVISHHQHHFWIKIPEELVQLKNLKGIVNVVDKEFKDIMKGFAESRSIAALKSLLYQEPNRVQFDDVRSSESTEGGVQATSRRSASVGGGAPPRSSASRASSQVDPPPNSTGLTLQQLLTSEGDERHSTTSPPSSQTISRGGLWADTTYFLSHLTSNCYTYLKRNSIILNSTPSMVHFTEYSPAIFYEIRTLYGIEGIYAESFEKPIKLHLAEGGASNALFFFSECRKFIAKSCTAEEMTKVRTNASKLRDHFQDNRNSLITRIFGAYKLQVYSSDLYFIVTNNVLLTDKTEIVTEKFDLKGSSVHRHMKLPRDGETIRCRLCGSAFVFNSKNHFRRDRDHFIGEVVAEGEDDEQDDASSVSVGDEEYFNGRSSLQSPPKDTATNTGTDSVPPPSPTGLKKTLSRRMSNRRALSTPSPPNLSLPNKDSDNKNKDNAKGDFGTICPLFRHVPDAVMKDNDFRGKAKIRLPPSVGDELIEQLYADCTFLAEVYEVMDYSLLVGVYKKVIELDADATRGVLPHGGLNSRWQAGEFVVDYSYYMGIIDYQQPYTLRKKLETWYKVHIGRNAREEISCIPPGPYKDRFLNFMEDLIY